MASSFVGKTQAFIGLIAAAPGLACSASADPEAPSGAGASGGMAHTTGGAATAGAGTSGGSSAAGSGGSAQAGASSSGGTSVGGSGGTGGGGTSGGTSSAGSQGTECGGIAFPMGTGGPSGGEVGQWVDVTPAGVDLTPSLFSNDNFGAQDVLVDPVRPSDYYSFFCHQGVYKSTDYGQTWVKVNTGTNGSEIESGKPWGENIDSNRCRDPETPPTLYMANSNGHFWRSTNGGVDWTSHDLPDDGKDRPQDVYDMDVDPYDGKHLILGFHEEMGLAESTDAGDTWTSITLDAGMDGGTSWYPFFIDTGDPETTSKTWLNIPQQGSNGTWRTSDGGASWTKVDNNSHPHGGSQLVQYQGAVYMAGVYSDLGWGVLRSTDLGVTWTHVGPAGSQGIVYATPNYVYAQPAPIGDQAYSLRGAQPGTTLETWAMPMSQGPKRASVSYDGSNYVIVAGDWNDGVWRYVEP